MSLQIDSREAESRFRARNERFFADSTALEDAIAAVFDREFSSSDTAEVMIFFLGQRCVDDFREVALLAANGYGWGATAHVRGMYERAVVAAFLKQEPVASRDFVDFDLVRRWKTAQAIQKTFGINAEDEAKLAQLKKDFEEVRSRFEVKDCAKCETTRLNHTWHKLNFVAMASKVGTLGTAIVPAYYMPLAQAHGTFASAVYRLGESDGFFSQDPELNDAEADRSFKYAHLILLNVLTVQHEFFKLAQATESLGRAYDHYRQTLSAGAVAG
jgi:hypothetical protein